MLIRWLGLAPVSSIAGTGRDDAGLEVNFDGSGGSR